MELPLQPNSSDMAGAMMGMSRFRNAEVVCRVKMAATGISQVGATRVIESLGALLDGSGRANLIAPAIFCPNDTPLSAAAGLGTMSAPGTGTGIPSQWIDSVAG